MAIDKNKLASIISGRARELCSSEGDKRINNFKGSYNGADPDPNSFNDYEAYDKMFLSEASSSPVKDIDYNSENLEYSKLPDSIKNSFATQKIDMTNAGGLSVLDDLGIVKQKKQIKEQSTMPVPKQNIVNASVDYSIIKAIVNECLKEYFGKQPINESNTLNTIGLKNGNISLVDNKGNIYKAKLEKIGNKNDRK